VLSLSVSSGYFLDSSVITTLCQSLGQEWGCRAIYIYFATFLKYYISHIMFTCYVIVGQVFVRVPVIGMLNVGWLPPFKHIIVLIGFINHFMGLERFSMEDRKRPPFCVVIGHPSSHWVTIMYGE
jgi:hypothetical protein